MDDHTLQLRLRHQAQRCLTLMAPCDADRLNHKVTARFVAQLVYENYQHHIERIEWDDHTLSGIADVYVMRVIEGIARDGDLVKRLMTHDDQAWIEIHMTIINRLKTKANDILTRDPAKLDDLVQDVQQALFRSLVTYPYDTEFQ